MPLSGFLLVASVLCPVAVSGAEYVKLQRQVLGWLTPLGNVGGCGAPPLPPCDISALAAACDAANASDPATATAVTPSAVPCVWSSLLPVTYIPGCPSPSGLDQGSTLSTTGCVSCQADGCFADSLSAQAACVANSNCGGITSEINGPPWELRSLAHALPSPTNESTYIITNAAECGHAPPPPPPGSGCNAFDTNGNLYHWSVRRRAATC
jgi:hypothetical protein